MKHDFACKLVGQLDNELLQRFKKYVLRESYIQSDSFESYAIVVVPSNISNSIINDFCNLYMSKFFHLEGHIGTNVAKMLPNSYVPEHSDYEDGAPVKKHDEILKFQIPIITNPGAGMMWRFNVKEFKKAECLNFKEGGIYLIDNVRIHSSVNFSSQDRYWLTSRWNLKALHDKTILN